MSAIILSAVALNIAMAEIRRCNSLRVEWLADELERQYGAEPDEAKITAEVVFGGLTRKEKP